MIKRRLASATVLALTLWSCGEGAKTPTKCASGEARDQVKCELPFNVDSFKLKGGVNVLSVSTQFETERTALRQIDQGLQRYSFQAKNLCERYNACQIDKAQYNAEITRLNEVLALKEKAEAAAAAPPDSQTRLAGLADAYRELVPDAERRELTLDFSVLVARPVAPASVPATPCDPSVSRSYELKEATPIAAGEAVPSGSRLKFDIHTSAKAYVYLFQKKASGKVELNFPQKGIAIANPLAAGASVTIPDGTKSFCSDHNDIGIETVYVVASLEPLTSLESTLAKIDAGDQAAFDSQFVGGTDSSKCKARALPLVDDGAPAPAPSGCLRPRGIPLVDDGPVRKLSMRTEPADKVIVGVFRFDHQRSGK